MAEIKFPYGTDFVTAQIPDHRIKAILESKSGIQPELSGTELVRQALQNPIGTRRLSELSAGKKNIVIIVSDQTRAIPSRILLPLMLEEIYLGSPEAEVTLLVAMGTHRAIRRDELVNKLGEELLSKVNVVVHNCDDRENLVKVGELPSGGDVLINRIAYEADLLCAEGLIEPHFFAGFSGGRKSVLPGISGRETVMANHCSANIDHPCARTGIMEDNPIHRDMLHAARCAKLAFILNVVINPKKEIILAVAGDVEEAHRAGWEAVRGQRLVPSAEADIVITSNGGYPLDQNIYQAVKCMTAAERTVKNGGVIIVLARANDGAGGEDFYRFFRGNGDLNRTLVQFLNTGKSETKPEQWQAQIFIRVMNRAKIIFISDAAPEVIADFHMIPASTVEEAVRLADGLLGYEGSITVIPNGTSVIVE